MARTKPNPTIPTPAQLKAARIRTGESLRTLAGRIPIDASTLHAWESLDDIQALALFKAEAWIAAVNKAKREKGRRDADARRFDSDRGPSRLRSS